MIIYRLQCRKNELYNKKQQLWRKNNDNTWHRV